MYDKKKKKRFKIDKEITEKFVNCIIKGFADE